MEQFIYHVVLPEYWSNFLEKEAYKAATFEEEGFIHCCTKEQIHYVLTTYFKANNEIVLLKINVGLLTSKLKTELANGQFFPHIYGPINKDAIVSVEQITQ